MLCLLVGLQEIHKETDNETLNWVTYELSLLANSGSLNIISKLLFCLSFINTFRMLNINITIRWACPS